MIHAQVVMPPQKLRDKCQHTSIIFRVVHELSQLVGKDSL